MAVDRRRLGDRKPYLYITRDYGKNWKLAVDGIASTHFVRAVREDPKQRNLLFAGTEFGIYVSFDSGDHWQSLQQNLPVSSVRDITIHDSDLIVTQLTVGRSGSWMTSRHCARPPLSTQPNLICMRRLPTTVRVDK